MTDKKMTKNEARAAALKCVERRIDDMTLSHNIGHEPRENLYRVGRNKFPYAPEPEIPARGVICEVWDGDAKPRRPVLQCSNGDGTFDRSGQLSCPYINMRWEHWAPLDLSAGDKLDRAVELLKGWVLVARQHGMGHGTTDKLLAEIEKGD
jgi:hypothetical protein